MSNQEIDEKKEADLKDLVRTLNRKKLIILSIAIFAGLSALVFSLNSPKVYQVQTTLEIGDIVNGGDNQSKSIIEDPVLIKEKINKDVYGLEARTKLGIQQSQFPQIKATNEKNIISFTVQSSDTELAKKILNQVNGIILSQHQQQVDSAKKFLENEAVIFNEGIDQAKKNLVLMQEEKASLEKNLATIEKMPMVYDNSSMQFMIFNAKDRLNKKKQEIGEYYLRINELEKENNLLNDLIGQTNNTAIIKEPVSSNDPISPRTVFNVALASALGLLIGMLAAFGIEWWKKS